MSAVTTNETWVDEESPYKKCGCCLTAFGETALNIARRLDRWNCYDQDAALEELRAHYPREDEYYLVRATIWAYLEVLVSRS